MRPLLVYGVALSACLCGMMPAHAQTARPAAKPQAPQYITAQSDVIIPFTVRATDAQGRAPSLVRIYVSLDQGQGWQLYQEVKPAEKSFRFRAKRDAEFWFATQTVNADGTGDRGDQRAVQLRLIVDTTKPQLQIIPKLEASGKVTVHWTATDPFLAANTIRLEWQAAGADGWQEITAEKPQSTRGQFTANASFQPPAGTTQMILRGEAADTAGNKTIVSQSFALQPGGEEGQAALVPAKPGNAALSQRWTPEQNDPYARLPQRSVDGPLRPQPNTALARVGPQNTLPPPREEAGEQPASPQLVRNPYSSAAETSARPANTGELLPPPPGNGTSDGNFRPFEPEQQQPAFNAPANERPPSDLPRPETIRSEPAIRPESINGAAPRRVEAIPAPSGARPRMTANKRFSLDYDVESIGPEGVADVELWGTADQGRTWMKWGSDPDRVTPFEVEVSNEAVYGFRIVIVGRNGLASNTPQAGDAADIWIGVDVNKPRARLTGASLAGGEHAGKLEIRWDAHDDHFGSRPITLAVSDRAAGPFTPIAAGLPNTGNYFWEFDPRIRRQLFIRLEAQDEAGNLSVDQLTDPIQIEGLAPRGRIRDLAPQSSPPPQAFRSPLFR
ncbi:hypothetical protein [Anatilimnocola floriformis]|uniref:hypothetical protein n=1 Tax=Anatilimnocola floriformis TaxID=2948575 RepID=UPI0020C24C76|nr:hypothetical protein [Anatilimnocola floriformis]